MKTVKLGQILLAAIMVSVLASSALADSKQTPSGESSININTATANELTFLPGIGASKAKLIVSYRDKRPFKRVEDIMRVKGIGRSTFKKIRNYISVDGPTTVKKKISSR